MLQDATEKQPVDPLAFYYLADAAERRGHPTPRAAPLLDYRALEGDESDLRRRRRLRGAHRRPVDAGRGSGAARHLVSACARRTGRTLALLVKRPTRSCDSAPADDARATLEKALEKDPANRDARRAAAPASVT